MKRTSISLAFVHVGTSQHSSTQRWKDYMEFWGKKNNNNEKKNQQQQQQQQ